MGPGVFLINYIHIIPREFLIAQEYSLMHNSAKHKSPLLSLLFFVHVIRFITHKKYALVCIYCQLTIIALFHWIKIDHVIMIDSSSTSTWYIVSVTLDYYAMGGCL